MIGPPKSANSIREIPMSEELMKIVKSLKRIVNGGFYILTNSPRPTEPRSYRNHFKRLMQKLDLPLVKFHGLRHSSATYLLSNGCDIKTVSKRLGHTSIDTTNIYVHALAKTDKAAADCFDLIGT